jgi:hypothetical protein
VAAASDAFREAVKALQIGKRLPAAVYLSRTLATTLPATLVTTLHRAERAAEPDSQWNLVKLSMDQYAITFLSYPDFDVDPHPARYPNKLSRAGESSDTASKRNVFIPR